MPFSRFAAVRLLQAPGWSAFHLPFHPSENLVDMTKLQMLWRVAIHTPNFWFSESDGLKAMRAGIPRIYSMAFRPCQSLMIDHRKKYENA